MCFYQLGKNTCSISTYYHSEVRIARQSRVCVFHAYSALLDAHFLHYDMKKAQRN